MAESNVEGAKAPQEDHHRYKSGSSSTPKIGDTEHTGDHNSGKKHRRRKHKSAPVDIKEKKNTNHSIRDDVNKSPNVQGGSRGERFLQAYSPSSSPNRNFSSSPRGRNFRPTERGHHQSPSGRRNHRERNNSHHSPYSNKKNTSFQGFSPYWTKEAVSDGLKRNELLQGPIRINPKNFEDSYVPEPNGIADIYISGVRDRNRALNADIVVIQIFPREEWRVLTDELDRFSQVAQQVETKTANKENNLKSSVENLTEGNTPHCVQEKEPSGDCVSDGTTPSKQALLTASPCNPSMPHDKLSTPNDKISSKKKRQNTEKRYKTLRDVVQAEDGVIKRLFVDSENAEQKGVQGAMEAVPDRFLQRTAKVVYIMERKHSRACAGFIKKMADKNPNIALFSPVDHRLPRIHIPVAECPKDFLERPDDYAKTLFIARIQDWSEDTIFPNGHLARSLGEAGQIEPETEGMLIEYGIDSAEFPQEVLECLPKNLPWKIPESEFEYRRDFRKDCVFTIDPATARDLDDALSVEDCGGGIYKVGVHIADVSFFLSEDTALDKMAQDRATSVYLVQKVIPMLPRLLCEQLCSLNPDEDRLTFSVEWTMTEEGEILDEWFGRSVICSCVKLSYDHAQGFIDDPDKAWSVDELPPVSEGFAVEDIKSKVLNLNKIAVNLRKQRFDSGALRLDQVKLQYALDKETGLPSGYKVYQQKDSNRLVEEFMLLANMAVAHKIYGAFPEKAVLRRHPAPQDKMLDDLVKLCDSMGIHIDADSAGALHRSLAGYSEGQDFTTSAKLQILINMCSKPMQLARYFCTGCLQDEDMFRHYALNVPLYTHFTSPIRRYPDVMVHRLLAAALDYHSEPNMERQAIQCQAEHCNDKKNNAKRVSELSSDMFFAIFVKECGPLEEEGMVMQVMDHSFDVMVLKLGVVKRVYTNKLPLDSSSFRREHKRPELTLNWSANATTPPVTQVISIFTQVHCVLEADQAPLKWMATIKNPLEQIQQSI